MILTLSSRVSGIITNRRRRVKEPFDIAIPTCSLSSSGWGARPDPNRLPPSPRVDCQRNPAASFGVGCESVLKYGLFSLSTEPWVPRRGAAGNARGKVAGSLKEAASCTRGRGGLRNRAARTESGLGTSSEPCHWTRVGILGSKPRQIWGIGVLFVDSELDWKAPRLDLELTSWRPSFNWNILSGENTRANTPYLSC